MIHRLLPERRDPPGHRCPTTPRSDQSRSDQSRSDQSRSDQSRSDQSHSDQSRSDQSRSDQSRSDQHGCPTAPSGDTSPRSVGSGWVGSGRVALAGSARA
ncbi:hypothetical protein E3T28_03700 [Cryobacterium sinapicolor]|uniref:Uncharacterized protein n=1 Tax=Cryobacterium sinapicolor TaxID=1259236 RepID=A0ABY2JE18_9MICO|nr:hypothetical protein E3T28_03700 [Cryobacterium sinapicolor]